MRGAALVLGLLLHTLLSRLLVAEADRLALQAGGSAVEWGRAAEIMWYEGDLIELAFLVAFVVQAWPPRRPAQKGLTARAPGIDAA